MVGHVVKPKLRAAGATGVSGRYYYLKARQNLLHLRLPSTLSTANCWRSRGSAGGPSVLNPNKASQAFQAELPKMQTNNIYIQTPLELEQLNPGLRWKVRKCMRVFCATSPNPQVVSFARSGPCAPGLPVNTILKTTRSRPIQRRQRR